MNKRNVRVKIMVAATLALSTFLAPATGVVAEATTVKAKTGVNLRASSFSSSRKVGYVGTGDYAKYLGTVNGYYKLSINGKVGYAYNSYLKSYKITATSNVNIRKAARSSASKVGYIYKGKDVKVLGRNSDWVYVEYNGKKGFAHKSYFFLSNTMFKNLPYVTSSTATAKKTSSSSSVIGNRVVAEARKLIGARYVLGGESWSEGGFDCSGLTQYSYGKAGYNIPRTASQQWRGVDTKISASNRRPGDIVVFARGSEVYHVGIYIGDNKMIHSPRPGKNVEIKTLDWHQSQGLLEGYLRPYMD